MSHRRFLKLSFTVTAGLLLLGLVGCGGSEGGGEGGHNNGDGKKDKKGGNVGGGGGY